MTEEEIKEAKETAKMEAIHQKQIDCLHDGEFIPVHQLPFADQARMKMVLITTIMCKKCGKLFFDNQDTDINLRMAAPANNPTPKETPAQENLKDKQVGTKDSKKTAKA